MCGEGAPLVMFARVVSHILHQGSPAVFIDGGNSFDPYLFAELIRGSGLGARECLERVYVSRAFTAHQLSSLITERLEPFVEALGAGLVTVSEIASLYFHRELPEAEARELFLRACMKLSEIAKRRTVLATYNPQKWSRRRAYFEAALFGRSDAVIDTTRVGCVASAALRRRGCIEPPAVDPLRQTSLLDYMEVCRFG